uniref:Ribosomal protein L32 n=1 Tax=Pedobesia claviformis TaxID=2364088 RepID=A0A386B0V3_9CHLO|nr:ribosomal protein L32 [Pedobesia claviformis]AYC65332.1 ribosomal protein L32 [Pedobesia claviformis]
MAIPKKRKSKKKKRLHQIHWKKKATYWKKKAIYFGQKIFKQS